VVELADHLEGVLQLRVVAQPAARGRDLRAAQAKLAGAAARIAHREDPQPVPFAAGALGAARAVRADRALEQRAAYDLPGDRGPCDQGLALAEGITGFHP
jgi:hypothetical protein